MLQKCTLGALYFTGSDHQPPFNFLRVQLPISLTLNILMRSMFGWIGGWLLWPGSNGDMICANRIIFCTLRRPSSVLSRRTVWRAIKSFSWIPAGRKNHLHETFWKMMVNLSWVDGAQVGGVLNKTVRDWVTFSTTRAVLVDNIKDNNPHVSGCLTGCPNASHCQK